jgi:tRNA-modifying protein YgfZ
MGADVRDEIRLLRDGAGQVTLDREVVLATGEAVVDYLQGQLSQDVEALPPGRAAWSFVLQPQGKVDAWFRIARLDDSTFVIDVDAGWSSPLITRLERFRLRTPVTFHPVDWTVTAVRGARAPEPGFAPDPRRGLVVPVEWPGEVGWDLIGEGGLTDGPPECSLAAAEVLRIESGRPRMGHELDDTTIPGEAGVVPQSVSFTKGCYTGQELVARIDSRGSQTPRRLVGIRLDGDRAPQRGDRLELDGAEVGRLTSVAPVSSSGPPVALGYLKRGVEVPVELIVVAEAGPLAARAVPLPLAPSGSV